MNVGVLGFVRTFFFFLIILLPFSLLFSDSFDVILTILVVSVLEKGSSEVHHCVAYPVIYVFSRSACSSLGSPTAAISGWPLGDAGGNFAFL